MVCIENRKEQTEYYERVHIGLEAMAIANAVSASFNGAKITIEDLVGGPPVKKETDKTDNKSDKETINKWKEQANQKGLICGKEVNK